MIRSSSCIQLWRRACHARLPRAATARSRRQNRRSASRQASKPDRRSAHDLACTRQRAASLKEAHCNRPQRAVQYKQSSPKHVPKTASAQCARRGLYRHSSETPSCGSAHVVWTPSLAQSLAMSAHAPRTPSEAVGPVLPVPGQERQASPWDPINEPLPYRFLNWLGFEARFLSRSSSLPSSAYSTTAPYRLRG